MNLNNFLTDVAEAIREKTGKTDTIKPASFDTEIMSITASPTETYEMYFIANGREQSDITEGYIFEEPVHLLDNANAVKQTDSSFNMYSGMWARGNVTFNKVLDLSTGTTVYVDFEFPAGIARCSRPECGQKHEAVPCSFRSVRLGSRHGRPHSFLLSGQFHRRCHFPAAGALIRHQFLS